MKRSTYLTASITAACALSAWTSPALAYIGPGAGLAAIGAFLALVLGTIVALFGFLWYPIKRLLAKKKSTETPPDEPRREPKEPEDRGADA